MAAAPSPIRMSEEPIQMPTACPPDCKAWHNPSVAASLLGVSRRTIYRLMADGEIQWRRRRWGRAITHEEIRRYQSERARIAE
jgi:excisionase family DNA binding protein